MENKRFITDCKDMVQCSLNVHEHPDKRKWFLFEKAGLSRKEREVFQWYPDHPFEQMESYGEMMLYYRLIVELIKENLTEFNLIFSREDWEKVLSLALKTIDFLKFTEDDVEELNYNFLVDFANAWNPSSS
ncbi:MAG: hypothetical protein JKY52_20760 [Flavobacteriales bacterium]|nr:hypothetical protein [Flavobacteriales bacterium]